LSLIFGREKSDSSNSTSNDQQTIGSDALQKAIERNKLKLLEKEGGLKASNLTGSGTVEKTGPSPNPLNRPTINFEEKLKQLKAEPSPDLVLPSPRVVPNTPPPKPAPSILSNKIPSSNPFTSPKLGLENANSKIPKWDTIKSNFFSYILKGIWIFSIVLLLRLIFADRGVLEYYFRRQKVQEKLDILDNQVLVNKKLKKEIERIQKDITFQKSLVRNHLGFIADDEFIIVLPEAKNKF
jgi:cell division protein FtsB